MKSFALLIQHVNPSSTYLKHVDVRNNSPSINFSQMNQAAQEAIEYVTRRARLRCSAEAEIEANFDCRCKRVVYEYEDTLDVRRSRAIETNSREKQQTTIRRSQSSVIDQKPSSSSSSSSRGRNNTHYHGGASPIATSSHHRPSEKFLVEFLRQFLHLFDVGCFLNAPTRLNHIYYKLGKLVNFKKAIQNIIDPSKIYFLL